MTAHQVWPQVESLSNPAMQAPGSDVNPEALLVSPYRQDRLVLERIFQRQSWSLTGVKTVGTAKNILRQRRIPLVISERDLPVADWKDLWVEIRDLQSPVLVVMSRMADEALWAEVLNFGGHDVLGKPLDEPEVLWTCRRAFSIATSLSRLPAGPVSVGGGLLR